MGEKNRSSLWAHLVSMGDHCHYVGVGGRQDFCCISVSTRWSAGSGHPPKHLPSQLLSVPPSPSQSSLCFLLFHFSRHQSLSVICRDLHFQAAVHLKILLFHLSFCYFLSNRPIRLQTERSLKVYVKFGNPWCQKYLCCTYSIIYFFKKKDW